MKKCTLFVLVLPTLLLIGFAQILAAGKQYSPIERIKDFQKIGYTKERIQKALVREMQIILLISPPETYKYKVLQEFIGVVESAWLEAYKENDDVMLPSKLKWFGVPEERIAMFISQANYLLLKDFKLRQLTDCSFRCN